MKLHGRDLRVGMKVFYHDNYTSELMVVREGCLRHANLGESAKLHFNSVATPYDPENGVYIKLDKLYEVINDPEFVVSNTVLPDHAIVGYILRKN